MKFLKQIFILGLCILMIATVLTGCKKQSEPVDKWVDAVIQGNQITTGTFECKVTLNTADKEEPQSITLSGKRADSEIRMDVSVKNKTYKAMFGANDTANGHMLLVDITNYLKSLTETADGESPSMLIAAIVNLLSNKYLEFDFEKFTPQTFTDVNALIEKSLNEIKPTIAPLITLDEKNGTNTLILNKENILQILQQLDTYWKQDEPNQLITNIKTGFELNNQQADISLTDIIQKLSTATRCDVTIVVKTISGRYEVKGAFDIDMPEEDKENNETNTDGVMPQISITYPLTGTLVFTMSASQSLTLDKINVPSEKRINPFSLFNTKNN